MCWFELGVGSGLSTVPWPPCLLESAICEVLWMNLCMWLVTPCVLEETNDRGHPPHPNTGGVWGLGHSTFGETRGRMLD